MLSHGSEGMSDLYEKNKCVAVQYISHGSESKYAIAPLVLLVWENTIL